jgi:hypothetical protein
VKPVNYSWHYWNLLFCRVPRTLGKALKILGKERSVKILLAKGSLPSVIYRALGKAFAEYDRNEKIMKK